MLPAVNGSNGVGRPQRSFAEYIKEVEEAEKIAIKSQLEKDWIVVKRLKNNLASKKHRIKKTIAA